MINLEQYPNDEELIKFIEEMEQGKLYAPAHLKEATLAIRDEKRKEKMRIQESRKKQKLFAYTLRVSAAMAAAIAVLFLISQTGTQSMFSGERFSGLKKGTQIIQEVTSSVCDKVNYYSNKLVSFELVNFKEDYKHEN